MKKLEYDRAIERVFDFCTTTGVKFLFVSGNGGAGKSTFALKIKDYFLEKGLVANLIDTDDFVTNSTVRKHSEVVYLDSFGNENRGTYNTSFVESYCINSLNATIYNLKQKLDFYHIPKRCKDESKYVDRSPPSAVNAPPILIKRAVPLKSR